MDMTISEEENSLLGGVFLQWDANVEVCGNHELWRKKVGVVFLSSQSSP